MMPAVKQLPLLYCRRPIPPPHPTQWRHIRRINKFGDTKRCWGLEAFRCWVLYAALLSRCLIQVRLSHWLSE